MSVMHAYGLPPGGSGSVRLGDVPAVLLIIEPMTPGRTSAFLVGVIVAWLLYALLYTLVDRLVEKLAELVAFVRDSSPYAPERRPEWVGFDHHELLVRGRVDRSP